MCAERHRATYREQDSDAQLTLLNNARKRQQKRKKALADRNAQQGKENEELQRARKELAEIVAAPVTNVFEDMADPDIGGESEPCPFMRSFADEVSQFCGYLPRSR